MARIEDRFDHAMMAAVSRLSDRVVALLSLALYAGGGLALPLALQWPIVGLVAANIVATSRRRR